LSYGKQNYVVFCFFGSLGDLCPYIGVAENLKNFGI